MEIFSPSAFKHGLVDVDIRHAYRHQIRWHYYPDTGYRMVVGTTEAGWSMEVGYYVSEEGVVLINHALAPPRPRYLQED